MAIQVGRYSFDGPFGSVDQLRDASGVYVVLCGPTNVVTDVGESHSVRTRVQNHDRAPCWRAHCSNTLNVAVLYVAEVDRMRIESELRDQFRPACGMR